MSNIYLEKIASKMEAMKAGAKKFGRAVSGADAKESGEALKRAQGLGKKIPLRQKMELGKMHAADKKNMYLARGAVGATGAAAVGGAAAAAKKD